MERNQIKHGGFEILIRCDSIIIITLCVYLAMVIAPVLVSQSVSKTDSREVIRQSFGRVQKCNGFARINVLINGGSNLGFLRQLFSYRIRKIFEYL